jgi:hypothetical protein
MVHHMKEEPASPDQRVPSQSKTARRGSRASTRARNWVVVRVSGAVADCDVEMVRRGLRRARGE